METANQTVTEYPWAGQTLAPLCTARCCGLLNRTLAVMLMVSLAFAIVVGNVVTLTVFMQIRHSRTPQGYLKGKHNDLHTVYVQDGMLLLLQIVVSTVFTVCKCCLFSSVLYPTM